MKLPSEWKSLASLLASIVVLAIIFTYPTSISAEPEIALTVFENGVDVVRAVFRIGVF